MKQRPTPPFVAPSFPKVPTPFLYDVRKGAQLFVENFQILKRLYLRERKSYRLTPGTVGKLDPELGLSEVGLKSLRRTVQKL